MTFREMLVRIVQNGRLVVHNAKLKTKKVFSGHKTSENVKLESETSRHDEVRSSSIGRQVESRFFDRLVYRGRQSNSNVKLIERLSKLRRVNALSFNPGVVRNTTLLGLLGVSFGAQQCGAMERDSLDSVCLDIQDLFGQEHREPLVDNKAYTLKDISFGNLIAKGCHAAVYEAKLKRTTDYEVNGGHVGLNLISIIGSNSLSTITEEPLEFVDNHFSTETSSGSDESFELLPESDSFHQNSSVDACDLDQSFDLAVKVMFNYDTESNAHAILQAMQREIVPARHADTFSDMDTWENGTHVRKRLPAHPNVVDMRLVLVGDTPLLTSAIKEFPAALPQRLCSSGCARNKTMFIVMKRYPMTLRDYLHQDLPQPRESTLLLAQLLEAVCHFNHHQVAHRDLKSDNILVEFLHEDSASLVVTDFGCCISDGPLQMPYLNYEISKGGNAALMAPEISMEHPGVGVILDFTRSDVWAVGALAYEIFGMTNPFYTCKDGTRLDSRHYKESDLPSLPLHVPVSVKKVISMLLKRCPRQRPSAAVAANMLYLGLWAPHLLNEPPSKADMILWLAQLTLEVIGQRLQNNRTSVEMLLKKMFLSRVNLNEILQALHVLNSKV